MLRTENQYGGSSENIKERYSSLWKVLSRQHQRGSLLIGLIITMVIIAVLGAGMVYLTSTSTVQELFANNHTRAYYAADAGGRYALSVIRDAYANDKTKLSTINANQIFTLADNGGQFQITNWVVTTNSANTDTVTFNSIGTVNSGVLRAKRLLTYKIQTANQSNGSLQDGSGEKEIDSNTLINNQPTGSMDFAIVTIVTPAGNEALMVSKDQGSGINAEAYVFEPVGNYNPFYTNWNASGGYSSYDCQVKVATGTLSGTTLSTTKPDIYANGLAFRADNNQGQKQVFIGVSLVRSGMLVPPYPTPTSYTIWGEGHSYVVGNIVQYSDSNYYQCILAHTSAKKLTPTNTTYWMLLTNDDKPMIVLWFRGSNQANGDGAWLAYKLLDQTGKDYIVDGSGHIKDWSTLLVRVVEAASVKLTVLSAPLINIGDTIAGATGTAKVFRKINDNDGNVVLLLNNIVGTFTRPLMIGTYNTDATWGYRSRDNYIWVFYTDQNTVTPTHSSTDTTPLETTGVNNIRLGQSRDTIIWPITDVQAWTVADDKFSLVNWNSQLNTDQDADIRIMGSGKEAGAIIRTDIPGWTRPGPYTNATFPEEIGLVSLGGADKAFFDDFACYLRGGSGGGGEDGSGSVIVSP